MEYFLATLIALFWSQCALSMPSMTRDKLYDPYQFCPTLNASQLNVHIVAHSHNDVGWLKSVDEYFYGDKNSIYNAGVQYILDTVIDELENNPERRFIYVEMSFFWRWWISRDESVHQRVIKLVNSGQLAFTGGGWSMNDEACNYYVDTIDGMTLGFRFLNDTFGPIAAPKVAWQIDPFGHSKENALLFQQMGFDGLFFARIDYQDKINRLNTTTMEMIWSTSNNIADSELFTGVLYTLYQSPAGFCFDIHTCVDPPIRDNPQLKDYNVDERVNGFLNEIEIHASGYATNNIMITMGGDFQYQDARHNFVNLDKLIKYVNERQTNGSNVNAFYSTPACYLKALTETGWNWTTKTDDFFPYASDPDAYWTGFYTSRPTFKGLVKYTNNFLQIAKQLTTFANVGAVNEENLGILKIYQADSQHHDAVTGTEKQAVNYDYIESLSTGLNTAQAAINSAFAVLAPNGASLPPVLQVCHYLNVSYCEYTESQANFVLSIHNPQGHNIYSQVRVPITGTAYTVSGSDGAPISSQVVPVPQSVLDDPERNGTAANDLVFNAELPPTGYQSYFVQSSGLAEHTSQNSIIQDQFLPQADFVIQNEYLSVSVDTSTGLMTKITDLVNSKTYNINQNFYFYNAASGLNIRFEKRASGAYIFRPNGTANLISPTANISLITGTEVQEIHQTFSDYVSQVIRLYPRATKVELEWMIGPIPVDDRIGKEIITLYSTELENDGVFYTDANGRQILKRIRDYRPTWNVSLAENISGNYYPINSRIYIQDIDQDSQFTVVTDRSEGGGSIYDGTIEIMLHRRLLHDDAKGVFEALNEPGVDGKGLRVRGKHWLQFSSIANAPPLHRTAGLAASNSPLTFISPLLTTVPDWISQFKTTFSGLTAPLPDNVNLVTLEPWKKGTVLIRFEHIYESTDDPNGLSNPVTFNVQNLFTGFDVVKLDETTLGANIWLRDLSRLSYTSHSSSNDNFCQDFEDSLNVTLTPMKIRTFIAQVQYK